MGGMKKNTTNNRKAAPKRVRLASGALVRCPLTGELIPACCCPVRK